MAIRNPFEFSQYSSSFTVDNILLDSSGIGITGISDLMSFVVTQAKIRQEAIRIGYIDNNPGIPSGSYDFVSLDNLLFDTPGAIFLASERIRDSILQMFKGDPSGIYERSAYKPTIIANEPPEDGVYDLGKAGGFFHKISQGGQPINEYYEEINDLIHNGSSVNSDDTDSISSSPPNFENYNTLKEYLIAQVNWINSVISILNQLRFIHKKLVITYPFTQVESGNSNSGCDYSYYVSNSTVGDVSNKPIEIILDMSEVVSSCTEGSSTYGYLCIQWTSSSSPSRMVVMPTKSPSENPQETDILRKSIWGSESSPNLDNQEPQVHNGTAGYYDPKLYSDLASGDNLVKTWDINGNSYDPPINPILDSGCLITGDFSPISPFRNGSQQNQVSDFACLRVTNNYFTTNTGSDWDNKLRLVIFPACSDNDNPGFSWNLTINCLGCIDCDTNKQECGGEPFNCIGYGSKVYFYDGTKKSVESIRVGDELLSVVFTDAESKDNPELSDLVNGWSISDSSKLRLVKTYVKSIFIGTEPEIYRFSNEIYLTYDHPVLVGQPDGSYNFVSAKYLSSSVEVISSNREVSYLYPAEVIPNKFVTFTIVTEPYNSIFVGGVLVHNASREHSQSIAGVGKFYDSSYDISHYQKVFGASYLPFNDEVLNPFSNSYINDGMYETLAISGPNGPIEGTSGSGSPTLEERIDDIVSDIDSGPGGPEIPPSSSSSSGEDDFSSSSSSSDGGGGGGSSSSSDDGSSSSSSDNGGGGSSSSSDGSSSSSSGGGGSSSSSSFGGSSSSSSSSSSSDDVFSSSSSSSKFTFS